MLNIKRTFNVDSFVAIDDPAILGRLNECLETILNKAQVSKAKFVLKGWLVGQEITLSILDLL